MNAEFLAALDALEKERGIHKDVLVEAIEAALVSAFRRNFGSTQNVRVVLDRQSGDLRVYAQRRVVAEVTDDRQEISLAEARGLNPAYEVGDVVEQEVTPRDFGRIAAQTAKQVVMQRLREAERGILYEEFQNREGDVVTGSVQRYEHRTAYIDLGRAEAILLPSEQIPGESYAPGTRLKAYVLEVRRTTKGPQIMVSRTHPGLLKRLLELEVPEIREGVVEVKNIAREAGARSKIAVHSRDRSVDAIGACVGTRGARIATISHELGGEKIDVILWSPVEEEFVANALAPARVTRVELQEGEGKVARVTVPEYQLSLAIGKEGQNARLAARLTGWRIDIHAEGGD